MRLPTRLFRLDSEPRINLTPHADVHSDAVATADVSNVPPNNRRSFLQRMKEKVSGLVRWLSVGWYLKALVILGGIAGFLQRGLLVQGIQAIQHASTGARVVMGAIGLLVLVGLIFLWWYGRDKYTAFVQHRRREDLSDLRQVMADGFGGAAREAWDRSIDEISRRQLAQKAELLTPVSEFYSNRLQLGDDAASTFPYVLDPVQAAYDLATRQIIALSSAVSEESDDAERFDANGTVVPRGDPARGKRGILVTGQPNAGKTRLAYQALVNTLNGWDVLQWHKSYTSDRIPSRGVLRNRRVVVWIDDLHDYASASSESAVGLVSSRGEILNELVSTVNGAARACVLIVTCRSGHHGITQRSFEWLFAQLTEVRILTFEKDSREAENVIELFERARMREHPVALPALDIGDWDGNLGTLLLGLGRREQEYLSLASSHDPAAHILRAMKLLTLAGTADHTLQRLQAVCSRVFGRPELAVSDAAWFQAIETLMERGFITPSLLESTNLQRGDETRTETVFVIRKDSYFDKVVTDYAPTKIPEQLETDFSLLHRALTDLGDPVGLYNLGVTYMERRILPDALSAFRDALSIAEDDFATWHNCGVVLYQLKQFQEALAAFERASKLRPSDAATLIRLGMTADGMARQVRRDHHLLSDVRKNEVQRWNMYAFSMYREAKNKEPANPFAWGYWARTSEDRGDLGEAEQAYMKAIDLDPRNPAWHAGYAVLLRRIGQINDAIEHERIARSLRDEKSAEQSG